MLASNEKDPHQAFVVRGNAYGVQFHPEFDAEIVWAYIRTNCHLLTKEGQNPKRMLEKSSDNFYGRELLLRFGKIIRN